MTKSMIKVDGLPYFIVPSGFVFVRQTCVKFYGKRLSKEELIKCCEHFIGELKLVYSPDRLKIGFNLNCFKYHELSVYLHGLISLLCSKIKCSCPSCFDIKLFSHLPHEVLVSEKESKVLEVAKVNDLFQGIYYCCVVSGICICSHALLTLEAQIYLRFPNLKKKYNISLVVK